MGKSTEQNHIGEVIAFDELGFQQTKLAWSRLLPKIEELATQYLGLCVGDFTTEVFHDLVNNGSGSLEKQIIDQVSRDNRGKSVITLNAALAAVEDVTDPVDAARSALLAARQQATQSAIYSLELPWSDIQIINGLPVIREDEMRKRFETRIETPEQNELYNRMRQLETVFNDFVDYVSDRKIGEIIAYDGYFRQQHNGKIELNADAVR